MTNYGFCFRPTLHRDDCSGVLHLWVEDDRGETCVVPTSYDVSHDEWDPIAGWLIIPAPRRNDARRNLSRNGEHREKRYGRIINIASTRWLQSEPGTEGYSASKGGIVSLTHALAAPENDFIDGGMIKKMIYAE